VLVAEAETRPCVDPKRSLVGALQEDRDELLFTIFIENRGSPLYRAHLPLISLKGPKTSKLAIKVAGDGLDPESFDHCGW
jgi:hypothetical protein